MYGIFSLHLIIGILSVIQNVCTLNKFDFQSPQEPRDFFPQTYEYLHDMEKISYCRNPVEYAHQHNRFKDIEI